MTALRYVCNTCQREFVPVKTGQDSADRHDEIATHLRENPTHEVIPSIVWSENGLLSAKEQ